MPTAETLLFAGGAFNLAFAIFHLLFWRLFAWKEELARLSFINRAIVQVLNLCLTFSFALFAYISFAHPQALLATALGHTLLGGVAVFWLLRAAYQIVFFKLRHWVSWAFLGAFIGGSALYGLAWAAAP
ncbi:MAG TPA: hypothetical protein VFF03_06960 [Rhodocyclaceae bacterium]|nr:hypothetical protein [Rhodocyclaceae bacterium]